MALSRGDGFSGRFVRCRELTVRANELEREISVLVRLAPPCSLPAGLWRALGRQDRGRVGKSQPVPLQGCLLPLELTTPIPVWSGNNIRHRLVRREYRRINVALHRIAVTQMRGVGDIGPEYLERRTSNGDTKTEALRLLRRRLSDEVFGRLLDDETGPKCRVIGPLSCCRLT